MIVSGMSGLLLLAPAQLSSTSTVPTRRNAYAALGAAVLLIIALGVAAFLIRTVPTIPGILVAYGRYAATWMGQQGDIFYVGEGLSSSVAVSRFGDVMNYHNAGKVQASSQPQDMRLQRMLGHFTTLVPKIAEESARHRLRRRRDRRRRQHRSERRVADHRRNRAARAARRLRAFRRAQFPRRPEPEDARRHRRCAAFSADDRRASSTRSRPIRSIRG